VDARHKAGHDDLRYCEKNKYGIYYRNIINTPVFTPQEFSTMSLLPFETSPDDLFSFSGSVGRFGDNYRDDVIKAQALLANAGYYQLPDPGMPTGWPGGELTRALARFQKDNGLEPDGTLLPLSPFGVGETGVGETAQALKLQLFDRLQRFAPPTVAEVDRFYRGRRPGEPEPETNIVLKSAGGESGGGEPIGVKPVTMSDEPPSSIDPKPGQQFALMRDPRRDPTLRDNFMLDGPFVMGGGGPRSRSAPPDKTPTPARPAPEKDIRAPAAPGQTSPEAAPGEESPQRGRIIIAEDGKELHVPPLGTWAKDLNPEDRQIAEALNDALAEEMAIKHGGSRGSKHTQEGVNAALQGCLEALQDVLPEAKIEHIAGGNPIGKADNRYLKEEHLWEYNEDGDQVRKGSNRSDWTIVIARNAAAAVRGNTYDTKDGKVTDREANAESGINTKADDDQMVMVEKHGGARTEADIRRDAYERCYDAAQKIRSDWTKKGEFEQPKPDQPTEYKGPANARRAQEIRRMRGKE
jgi:peptidoglycan hydrolase-like protein with peptidoglycan-binding domain